MNIQMVSLEKRLSKSKLKAELYRSKYNRVANRNISNTNTNNMQPNSLLNLKITIPIYSTHSKQLARLFKLYSN